MAGPEQQQLDHAAEIQRITEQRRADAKGGGEPISRGEIQAMIAAEVAKAIKGQKVSIQNADDIIVTGSFPNFTIGRQPSNLTITGTIDCSSDPPTLNGTISG